MCENDTEEEILLTKILFFFFSIFANKKYSKVAPLQSRRLFYLQDSGPPGAGLDTADLESLHAGFSPDCLHFIFSFMTFGKIVC